MQASFRVDPSSKLVHVCCGWVWMNPQRPQPSGTGVFHDCRRDIDCYSEMLRWMSQLAKAGARWKRSARAFCSTSFFRMAALKFKAAKTKQGGFDLPGSGHLDDCIY